ncbi:1,4-dihydroxy-2-naphthoate octaprenyltransferase [Virgibacillus natechei]|uniref:1,4-dihydroxy-2-naphthoate octaprenyltransferase n=1 Tax=Virgibacillus natechei TaxID=1216297 RepID=A0ABS4IG45_9BACI|nr:hypothetical protein [Virgibacillus natechei]MBP1969916.1 1,4-dihydroxy-2-naphthoate octaprenyltransferase [Virgibacillus natechei]UZD13419.1 hypothetical protein OLD84_02335 [Virgibacillus natechei]
MDTMREILLICHIPFSATISPVLAGTALAALEGPIRYDILIVLLLAALFIQASAKYAQ